MTEEQIHELMQSWDNFEITLKKISESPADFPTLMQVGLYSKNPNSWRAIYLADRIHDLHPEWLEPYLPKIIEQLKVEKHHGKLRHFLKLVSMNPIPEKYFGFLLDHCLSTFTSDKEPIANRVHAMQILFNISESEPELKPELLEIIQQEMEHHPTPGIRSRGGKLVRKLQRQISA